MTKSKKIVVLQRGWVAIGDLTVNKFTGDCVLESAAIIRRWGTTNGLGQLALDGPTAKTVLDPAGTITYHPLTAILTLDTDGSKW